MVDFFGFGLPDVKKEVMSMYHSHDAFGRLIPRVGDSMVTNLRRPIFTLLEDTGPGVHDTTVSACDQYLYQQQIGVVSHLTLCESMCCICPVRAQAAFVVTDVDPINQPSLLGAWLLHSHMAC